jgi:hypothetical protein
MTWNTYDCSLTSNRLYPRPYPSPSNIISCVDGPSNNWFHWPGYELHLWDFVWLVQMQTARRLLDCTEQLIPNCVPILDHLLEEGTFNRGGDIDTPNSLEEFAMGHLSAMTNHLLMQIESLGAEVRVPCFEAVPMTDGILFLAQSCSSRLWGPLLKGERLHRARDGG